MLAESVNLRVLSANGLSALLRQRLLKGRKHGAEFLPVGTAVVNNLTAHFALGFVVAFMDERQQFCFSVVRLLSEQQPQDQQHIDHQ